jgi:hypothetical protein
MREIADELFKADLSTTYYNRSDETAVPTSGRQLLQKQEENKYSASSWKQKA